MNYKQLNNWLGKRNEARLRRSTTARRDGAIIRVFLNKTEIMTYYPEGRIEIAHGGYTTSTTKRRINEYLPGGFMVMQENFHWLLKTPKGTHYKFPDRKQDITRLDTHHSDECTEYNDCSARAVCICEVRS